MERGTAAPENATTDDVPWIGANGGDVLRCVV
jgi:hypothetical protein